MSTKKKPANKGARTSRHKNTAAATGGAARGAAAAPKGNPAPAKKRSHRHKNSAGRFNLSIAGMTLIDLLAVGGGALLTQIITNVIPLGAAGSWVAILEGFGIAWGVHYLAPASVKKSATAGAVAAPVVSLANKLVPNLQTWVTNQTAKLTAMIPGTTAAQGQAGFVTFPTEALVRYEDAPQLQGLIATNLGVPGQTPLYRRS